MTDDLTRQDEDLSAAEFGGEERGEGFDFRNRPELAGAVATAIFVWLSFAFVG